MAGTIFALSSAPGRAGVAVIRVSGPNAGRALTALVGRAVAPRRATLCWLTDPETCEAIDRALVLWFPAPHSFTGEAVAEFHVHGGPAVVAAMLAALARFPGYEPAEPGAFTRRAFDNGKLDLTAVEGLADLIAAETEGQRRAALDLASGSLRAQCDAWRWMLTDAMAQIEAGLDFMDEGDVPAEVAARARPIVASLHEHMRDSLDDRHRGEILRDGFQVVLAGPPNVGKSSLLNALAGRDVAIVSDEPGTTRDALDVRLDLGGYPVRVTDTAGLREAVGAIEAEGIRRTRARLSDAQLVVWLADAAAGPITAPDAGDVPADTPVLLVANKMDMAAVSALPEGWRGLSVRTGLGLDDLIAAIEDAAADRIMGPGGSPLITRARHRAELERAAQALSDFLDGDPREAELRAEDLRLAAAALGRLTGRIDVEDVLGSIFGQFCIGK